MKFKAGDKIRCINTDWTPEVEIPSVLPVYQGIYTVLRYTKTQMTNMGIVLSEIPYEQNGHIFSFFEWHFELATENNTEMIAYAKEELKVKQHQLN